MQDPTSAQQMGKMKVPTLRNVDKRPSADFVKAYAHNGYFKSLDDIVPLLYLARHDGRHGWWRYGRGGMCGGMTLVPGVSTGVFPKPEANQNLATLNHFPCRDQGYIVAFLKTLSDGYFQR